MNIIAAILIISSIVFTILGFIGLFNPAKGGFWIGFMKEKKRFKVFVLNLLAGFFLIIIGSILIPTDNYEQGLSYLESQNYKAAIDSFNKIDKDDENYSKKDGLIQKVKNEATSSYSSKMDTSIINLNQTEIDSLNNSYKEIFNENYLSDADVSKLITKRISTLEYEVESLMNNKDYDSAIAIADKLIKHDKSKERATNTITEINTIRREIIKESINTAIDSNDVDTAKELLTKLSEIGGGDEFINSKSTIIQRIEDDAKIRSIFTDVNSLLRESNYTDAKSKVYELRELGYTEDQITSTISKVENHEKAYLKDMADREAKAYKEDALNVTYASILRDPDKYIGKVITVRGEIVEVQNDIYRLSTKYNMGLGYFGNDIIFDYKQKGIIRGDVVRIYGVLKEIKDHAIIGALPVFSSEVVDIEIKLF